MNEIVPSPARLAVVVHAPGGFSMALPATVVNAGNEAGRLTLEFFAARIANDNTRKAYVSAVVRFCRWSEAEGVSLLELTPTTVAAYYQNLKIAGSVASLKLHASGLRHWLDYLTEHGVLRSNPALSVRTPRLVIDEGKTPVLEREEARKLFASLDGSDILTLRDRAMFAVMLFGFPRIGAVVGMRLRDFEDGENASLVLHEKGGKERRIPCHHLTHDYLRAYVVAAGITDPKAPLFQAAPRRSGALNGEAISSNAAWKIVKRRCAAVGLSGKISNHSFRATGITLHQEAGGRLEDAQLLAGHADARTTRLYVRTQRKVARAEVERVQL